MNHFQIFLRSLKFLNKIYVEKINKQTNERELDHLAFASVSLVITNYLIKNYETFKS